MPAHITAADLKKLKANAEEMAAAKAALEKASGAEKRSKMASMVAWLKSHPHPDISQSRGADREAWLAKFMVHHARCRQSKKEILTSRETGRSTQKFQDVHMWAWEEMDLNMGAAKGKAWRESGLLPSEPCPLTKSTSDDLKVYIVPVAWQRMTDTELKNFVFATRAEATEKEFEALLPDEDDQPLVKDVKREPLSAAEQKAQADSQAMQAEQDFVKNITAHIQKLTAMECDSRGVQSMRATVVKTCQEKAKYTEQLSNDIDKHVKALMRLSSTFKTVASATFDHKGVSKLMETWGSAQATHTCLMERAAKFDLKPGKMKKQKTLGFEKSLVRIE